MKKAAIVFIFLFLSCFTSCGYRLSEDELSFTEAADSEAVFETEEVETAVEVDERIIEIISQMTDEEKVGQIFLARCPTSGAVEDIERYHLGGYILFGRDFEYKTPETVIEMTDSYQNAAKIPLILAVDEEGGDVCRVSSNPELRIWEFPSPRDLFKIGGMDRIINDETEKSLLLRSLGLNVNMAPVCDITTNKKSFMYSRSLGQDKTVTSEFVSNFVSINNTNNVGCVLKHFPGYGNNTDTHTGKAVDTRTLEELESNDLVPFSEGIKAGAPAVLFSHTVVNCFDSEYPVSLSVSAHRYIREAMGFKGVIITDDLVMDAIKEEYGTEEAAVLAVLAGNDLLCSSEYQKQYNAVLNAVKEGRVSEDILNDAVYRVLVMKRDIGLI